MSLASSGRGSSKSAATQPADFDADSSDEDRQQQQQRGTYAAAAADNADLDDWSEGGEDDLESEDPSRCLFCARILPTQVELKAHFAADHQFDFRGVAKALKLDFYQQMKVINYIRERISKGDAAAALVSLFTSAGAATSPELAFLFDGSEAYLKPFMQDDPLLFSLPRHSEGGADGDDDDEEEAKVDGAPSTAAASSGQSQPPSVLELLQENQGLRNELAAMQEAMLTMQATLKRLAFSEEDDAAGMPALDSSSTAASSAAASSTPAKPAEKARVKPADCDSGSFAPELVDRDYFGGYSGRNIHELMLRDTIRTEAYRDFIYGAQEIFKDKVVLDVGCGTGILSMFAARMGARKVIGVDAADIVHKAREIISANGFSSVIEIVHGRMEEVVLPVDKVDIIISEWMGYFLLFESMLPSVLYARDKYLRSPPSASQSPKEATGVYPDKALMFIAGIQTSKAHQTRVDWWSDVYGFNMSCLVEERERYLSSTVEIIRPEQVVTNVVQIKEIDCQYAKDAELDFTQAFTLDVLSGSDPFTAFMVYFDTLFAMHCKTVINLSTAPHKDNAPGPEMTTHWQQSVFYLAKPLSVVAGDQIRGSLKAKRMASNPRAYDVVIEYALVHEGKEGVRNSQAYKVQ